MPAPRPRHYFPLLPIVVGTALLAVPFHFQPQNFIVDDGYFYPQIARYIAHGQGSSFNGIMLTNGYHPLWMLVCVGAAFVTSSSMPLLQLLSILQDIILLACVVALVAIARKACMRGAAFSCLVILFFNMVLGIWRLLETPLALLLQIAALVLATDYFPALKRLGAWRPTVLGATLGLVLLARLDLIFFVLTILVYYVFAQMRTGERWTLSSLWKMLVPALATGLFLTPYLLWNWEKFHHLLPISGSIKNTFPHVQAWHMTTFTLPVVLGILINGTLFLKRVRTNFDALCLLSAWGAAFHLAFTLSFGGLAPWYLTTGYLSVALCIMWTFTVTAEWISSLQRWEIPLAVSLFVFCFTAGALRAGSNLSYTRLKHGQVSFRAHYTEPKYALASRIKQTLPKSSRLFIFDAPGGVAYFSGLSLLPVDGLVANYAYDQDLAQQRADGYARDHHINYMIAPLVADGQVYDRLDMKAYRGVASQIVELQTPLTHRPAGDIKLTDSNLLFAFREINPDLEKTFPLVGVWRIRPSSE